MAIGDQTIRIIDGVPMALVQTEVDGDVAYAFLTDDGGATEDADKTTEFAGFRIPDHDAMAYTYVASGNGVGQVETIVFSLAASTVATLTYTYDASNRVANIALS